MHGVQAGKRGSPTDQGQQTGYSAAVLVVSRVCNRMLTALSYSLECEARSGGFFGVGILLNVHERTIAGDGYGRCMVKVNTREAAVLGKPVDQCGRLRG